MGGDTGGFRQEMKESLRRIIIKAGALKAGFAKALPIDEGEIRLLRDFVGEGRNAGMDYLARHVELRSDPRNILPSVKTVVSCAFSYAHGIGRRADLPHISTYAWGNDYHDVIRGILNGVMKEFSDVHPVEWRVCVDSAPLPERWWALKCGIGERGLNGNVIVGGAGSLCFLAEILLSAEMEPDVPSRGHCNGCGRCVASCPSGALRRDGSLDARKCISYLTIEHRGEWDEEGKAVMAASGGSFLFGCDRCVAVCPHNNGVPSTAVGGFEPRREILELTEADVMSLTPESFSRFFKGSPLKRAKLQGLQRNLRGAAPSESVSEGGAAEEFAQQ